MIRIKLRFICVILLVWYLLSCNVGLCSDNSPRAVPKNIVILISDGCGYNHIDATSLYQFGHTGVQSYEKFPIRYGMSTFPYGSSYNTVMAWSSFEYVKTGYTDSAAAATAMSTGIKTRIGYVGIDDKGNRVVNLIELAEQLGKSTGLVTTVQWSHTTPAGFVAHSSSRYDYSEIARQIIYKSSLDVVMGCGHPFYDDDGKYTQKPETFEYVGGQETWNALVAGTAESDADADGDADAWLLIQSRDEFCELISGPTPKRICGTAQALHTLQQGRSGDTYAPPFEVPMNENVPTLAEMTKGALNVLDEDEDGFFLMIESGAVDWASHRNQSGRMIEEQIAFNKAVEAVIDWVTTHSSWEQSLVIVTADHETGYLTGPASGKKDGKPEWSALESNGRGSIPLMRWNSTSHTNSLVPFYAKGCGADEFKKAAIGLDHVRGRYIDNTDIAKILFSLLKKPI